MLYSIILSEEKDIIFKKFFKKVIFVDIFIFYLSILLIVV